MSSNYRQVYSTDPKDLCGRCKKPRQDCKCRVEEGVHLDKLMVNFRLEKNGRGGKTVTILDDLPKNDAFLKSLTKELKTKCGTGGTYKTDGKAGRIEIQGDKLIAIKTLLDAKQIRYKGF